jgi:hypothetical protein
MKERPKTMTPFSANPYVYVFAAIVIGAVLVYYGFGLIDRMGVEVRSSAATVTGKQYTAGGKTYVTNVAGGRTWTQAQETPETYAVTLNVGGEPTVGLVSKQMFESLNAGDKVNVKFRRTRITKRLEVIGCRGSNPVAPGR